MTLNGSRILVLLLFTQGIGVAEANVGEAYGFGSRSAALAGAGAAWGFDGYASYFNPAAIGVTSVGNDEKRVVMSWSLIAMRPRFLPIDNVVVENEYTSDAVNTDNVDMSYRDTLGQAVGASFRLFPDYWNISAGITTFLPIMQAAYMDTGSVFIPEYVMYRSRTQRPQFNLGWSVEPLPGISFGAGAYIGFSLTSKAEVFLQTETNKPSTMRFASSAVPKAAPFFGVHLHPVNWPWSLGVVGRLPLASANTMTLLTGARAFGSLAALDFQFRALSSLYYDPASVEIGTSFDLFSLIRLFAQVDYQAWSKYQAPALAIQNPETTSCEGACGIVISPSANPTFAMRDILVPRFGTEVPLGPVTVRGGYSYHQSVFKDVPTGAGNYLDPSKHIWTAGAGIQMHELFNTTFAWTVDLHAAYHDLITQEIVKTEGDEAGQGTGDLKIGAPGYFAGGKIFGGGVSLSLAL